MNSTPQQSPRAGSTPNSPLQQGRPGDTQNSMRAKMPPGRTWLWLIAALVANYLMVRLLFPNPQGAITVPYTFFREEVAKGNVASIYNEGQSITGRFKTPVTYPPPTEKKLATKGRSEAEAEKKSPAVSQPSPPGLSGGIPPQTESMTSTKFATTLPTFVGTGLEKFLIDHGVEISAKPMEDGGNPFATFLLGFGPALLFIGFYIWMFRRAAQQGGMGG
jgi:cell division protease FtsH